MPVSGFGIAGSRVNNVFCDFFDHGSTRPESGAQPQRNPGGAETENAVQPEHRNEGAAADGDIHSGAGLGMGYDQELRELADSGSSVEEHDNHS